VRRIQAMRKDAGFDISDRITTWYQAGEAFASVFHDWAAYIQTETLTTQLVAGPPPAGAYSETQKVEGESLLLGVRQNKGHV
jgi:isoleucyl-tRNA synthetase